MDEKANKDSRGTVRLNGEKVRELREEKGWTQEYLAACCVSSENSDDPGGPQPMSVRTIQGIESNSHPVLLGTARMVADALAVTLKEITMDSEPGEDTEKTDEESRLLSAQEESSLQPSIEVTQKVDVGKNVTGLDADEITKGRVTVEQEIGEAKDLTGARIKRIGR